jgi:hypothetical protein
VCWTLLDRASSLVEPDDFRPSLCAATCRRLPLVVAPKGQEKGDVNARPVEVFIRAEAPTCAVQENLSTQDAR